MKTIRSKDIFDPEKCKKLAAELAGLDSSLVIFGLPHSGKSTLVQAICETATWFRTLPEEEVLNKADQKLILKVSNRFWAVGHQFPSQNQGLADLELEKFAVNQGFSLDKWQIVRIVQ